MAAADVTLSPVCKIDVERRELRTRNRAVPLGGRAFELLEVLVASNNELVTKERLMARVWAGAIVEDNTLQVHVSAIRKALGPDRALLQTASGRGYRLLGHWTTHQNSVTPATKTPTEATRAAASSLLLLPSDLIGRGEEIQHVSMLLSAYRVVTLTGPGGIGKTSLAVEVARQSAKDFEAGAHLIEFAAIADPTLVPSTVARALGLSLGASEASAASVAGAIGDRAVLLVLDNCEHLIDAAAAMAEALVRTCSKVVTVATSRELLRIDGEYVYRVPPLSFPPEGVADQAEVMRHGAIRLFVARTRALGFDPAAEGADLRAVGAICRRLDGIPLAIEFAAARAATLGPEYVLSRLEDRLAHLTVGRRTALPRHQTLRAALDWSYELLPSSEQCQLRQLAVFAGGFTLEAVAAVTRDASGKENPTAESISMLVAKSLVSVEGAHPATRWRLLETIRAYALDKLGAAGELRETARRHAEHYRNVVERRPAMGGLAACGDEIDNVRAALDWCFSDTGDAAVGIELTAAYAPVWLHLAVLPECRVAVEHALARCGPQVEPRIRLRLLIALGLVLSYTGEPFARGTEDVLSEALDIAENLDHAESQILTLWGLWTLRMRYGDHRAAISVAAKIQAVAGRSGKAADIAVGNRALGTSLFYTGKQSAARRCLEYNITLPADAVGEDYEALMATDVHIHSRATLARVLLLQGLANQARDQARISYELALNSNHRMSICFALRYAVCETTLTLGDLPAAEAAVAKLVEAAATFNIEQWTRHANCLEAILSIRLGDYVGGASRLRSAIDANSDGGFLLCHPAMLGVLAEGFATGGRRDEALATLAAAVALSEEGGETWYLPELFRLEGDLALHSPSAAGVREAEAAFLRALRLARRQNALLWEVRAASSLARLRLDQDRPADARRVLAPVFARVTEGDTTRDVQNAQAILSQLA